MTFTERLLLAIRQKIVPDRKTKKLAPIGYNALGEAIGKKQSGYISTLIAEERTPVVETIRELARALEVRFEWLANEEGPMRATAARSEAAAEHAERTIRVYDPRYPNFDLGAAIVRSERDEKDGDLADTAIDRVSKRLHDYGGDATPTRWAQLIVAEMDILRTRRRALAQDVVREAKEAARDVGRARALEKQTKPRLPARKR